MRFEKKTFILFILLCGNLINVHVFDILNFFSEIKQEFNFETLLQEIQKLFS